MIDSLSRDSPPTSTDGLHPLSEVGESCGEPVGIAAADDEGRCPWTSPGTVCRAKAKADSAYTQYKLKPLPLILSIS